MPKKILVTGANGFTGSHLCRKLVEQGHRVRALVRPNSDRQALNGLDLEIHTGDISEDELPQPAFRGVEQVYHVAAIFRQEGVPVETFHAVNAEGTRKVLQAALQAGVERVVHTSTIGVLGHVAHPPANEETPYNPGDHYQSTKMEGEQIALEFHRRHGLPLTVVRPGSIYGPGDLRFAKLFKTINKGVFFIIGPGTTHLHFVYIDDLTDGMILAMENDRALGEVFILTGEHPVSIKELASCIAGVLGRPAPRRHLPYKPLKMAAHLVQKVCQPFGIEPPLYPRRLDFFVKNREFDISKARAVLGYQPQVDLQTGLERTAQWYRENKII